MKQFYVTLIALLAMTLSGSAQNKVFRKTAVRKAAQELAKPVAKPATGITATGFTANWEKVDGAEGYAVSVYNRTTVETEADYTVLDEDFSGIIDGSLLEPLGGDESYVDLDDYDYADNAGWSAYGFPNFVPSMVAGLVYSPYLNLTNNDGKYKLIITTYSNNGDVIRVTSHGKGEAKVVEYTVTLDNGGSGSFTKELDFDNGIEDLFFSIINNTAEVGEADYLDRVQVVQHLKKGDVYHKLVAIDEAIDAVNEYTNADVTSKTFTNVTKYADGATTLYYNIAAGAYNWYYDENNTLRSEYKQSPYSDWVKVDLTAKATEVEEPEDEPGNTDEPDQPVVGDGTLTLGHFDGDLSEENFYTYQYVAYDGANFYNAPMTFVYRNSGSQNIYLPEELQEMKDQYITSISFSCVGTDSYWTDDYKSTAKIYVNEIDATEFYKNPETDNLEWFDLDTDDLAATEQLELDFQASAVNGENITITFDLSQKPYLYTGKTLLLTVTNESSQYLESGEYVRFYWIDRNRGDANRTCLYVNDDVSKDFLWDLAQNRRILTTENENQNYNAPAVQFTYESPTAISTVTAKQAKADNAWYTLQGVRVAQPTKGIFIHNGKKVVVK